MDHLQIDHPSTTSLNTRLLSLRQGGMFQRTKLHERHHNFQREDQSGESNLCYESDLVAAACLTTWADDAPHDEDDDTTWDFDIDLDPAFTVVDRHGHRR